MQKKAKKLVLSRETLTALTTDGVDFRKIAAGVSVQTCPLACTPKNHFCVGT